MLHMNVISSAALAAIVSAGLATTSIAEVPKAVAVATPRTAVKLQADPHGAFFLTPKRIEVASKLLKTAKLTAESTKIIDFTTATTDPEVGISVSGMKVQLRKQESFAQSGYKADSNVYVEVFSPLPAHKQSLLDCLVTKNSTWRMLDYSGSTPTEVKADDDGHLVTLVKVRDYALSGFGMQLAPQGSSQFFGCQLTILNLG